MIICIHENTHYKSWRKIDSEILISELKINKHFDITNIISYKILYKRKTNFHDSLIQSFRNSI